ncbi:MAG: chemotaxis protein CheW [Syntrophomonas sp.]
MREIMDEVLEEDTQKGKFLTFIIGREEYGIEIRFVTEIIGGIQRITVVPEVPDYVKGIINLRGKIIPVIDVNLRFKKEAKEYGDRTCIIVVNIQDISVGMIVDNVAEVLSIAEEDIVAPPDIRAGFHHRYIKGIGKVGTKVVLILDCDKLLSDEEYNTVGEIA